MGIKGFNIRETGSSKSVAGHKLQYMIYIYIYVYDNDTSVVVVVGGA